jgi:hypothetical protein
MRITISVAAVAIFCALAGTAAAQTAVRVSPQSLAGDWDSAVGPSVKLVLHLDVSADGTLSGTIDAPGSPPKRLRLSNVHLTGSMLNFTLPTGPGTYHEVILAGAKKMAGPYMWVKEGAIEQPRRAPPFEPLARLAGDWESPGVDSSLLVLRLRLSPRGELTGTIDVPEPMAQRVTLRNVVVSGRLLTYTMPDGVHTYQGTFTQDGGMVEATGMSTIDATWRHVRTAAQAAAKDASGDLSPTNGDWTGTGDYTASFPGIGPRKGTMTLTFHFRSDPASCLVKVVGSSDSAMPCRMTVVRNTVRVERVLGYEATFTGTLSADRNHLSGTWTMGKLWYWTGPMHVDLTRAAQAQ